MARLLDEGVDVNVKGRYSTTALFFAADKGHLAVVDLLLARGGSGGVLVVRTLEHLIGIGEAARERAGGE